MNKAKYTLLVEDGEYTADSLITLIFTVLTHRFQHLCKGEGWRD